MTKKEKRVAWRDIMQRGFFVQLNVSFFRGDMRLNANEARVPDKVARDPKFADLFSLGRKRIAPESYAKAVKTLESTARQAIYNASHDLALGRFVPAGAWEELAPRLADYEARFWKECETLWSNWDDERAVVLDKFREAFDDWCDDEDEVAALMQQVEEAYPALGAARSRTAWSVNVFQITPPEDVPATKSEVAAGVQKELVARLQAEAERTVGEFARQLRAGVLGWAAKQAEAVEKRGRVTKQNAAAVRRAIKRFRSLDVLGDIDVQEALDDLLDVVGVEPGSKEEAATYAENVAGALRVIERAATAPLGSARFSRVVGKADPAKVDVAIEVDASSRERMARLAAKWKQTSQEATAAAEPAVTPAAQRALAARARRAVRASRSKQGKPRKTTKRTGRKA